MRRRAPKAAFSFGPRIAQPSSWLNPPGRQIAAPAASPEESPLSGGGEAKKGGRPSGQPPHGLSLCQKSLEDPVLRFLLGEAQLIHEAAIGKIAGDQLLKLETLGLSPEEAEETILKGFLA